MDDDVLAGGDMFVCRVGLHGDIADERGIRHDASTRALIVGAEYLWGDGHLKRSFLWRTTEGKGSISGFSGAVLVAGKPSDKHAKAICFQSWEDLLTEAGGMEGTRPWIRGGFMLPEDIKQSEILMQPSHAKPKASTLQYWHESVASEDSQRAVTNPALSTGFQVGD